MARAKSDARLEAKLAEADRLKAEIRKLKGAAKEKIRAQDELRGQIVGRVVLAHMRENADADLTCAISQLLMEKLTKENERALFTNRSPTPPHASKIATTASGEAVTPESA